MTEDDLAWIREERFDDGNVGDNGVFDVFAVSMSVDIFRFLRDNRRARSVIDDDDDGDDEEVSFNFDEWVILDDEDEDEDCGDDKNDEGNAEDEEDEDEEGFSLIAFGCQNAANNFVAFDALDFDEVFEL